VVWVDQHRLEPLLGAVFADPVAGEHAQVRVLPRDAFLADPLGGLPAPDPVDTLSFRPAAGLVSLFARVPLPDGDASDDDPLFGLVAQFAGLVQPGGAVDADDGALIAPLLFSLPLQFGEFPVARVSPRL